MDFIDRIRDLVERLSSRLDHVETEEATKNALVMPFINALGYNVFDPTEVVPEFVADVGTKRGEKVDYAIMKDGKPIILIECKSADTNLTNEHASQLYRYFSVTDTRFAILTNGIVYHFYTDLDKSNRMDDKPFLVVDLDHFDDRLVDELKKFTKSTFDVDVIISTASDLKYRREISHLIADEFMSPSEPFVRHFAKQVYSGSLWQNVLEEFTDITRQALRQFVNDQVRNRLQSAIDTGISDTAEIQAVVEEGVPERVTIFTEEEREGFHIVKAILREVVDPDRIYHRDTMSYCGILLDDNNRKTICRMHFNRSQKYLGLLDADKNEERVPIGTLNEIYQYADRLKAMVVIYDGAGAGE